MRILAIETSLRPWSIALLDKDSVVSNPSVDAAEPISRGLLPLIQEILVQAGWTPRQLDLIAVSRGPGSFTGLRVGITAAKVLAYAIDCSIVACNSLEIIAIETAHSEGWLSGQKIRAVIDAQRSEVFVAAFQTRAAWELECVEPVSIVPAETCFASVSPNEILTGPALSRWKPAPPAKMADQSLWHPRADRLGQWAFRQFERGVRHDPFAIVPDYYRPSYAEEK